MAVNTPLRAYREMASKWELPLALMGGTARMRKESKDWLPQLPNESDDLYQIRVERSFLFNVYRRTILSMVGNAFNDNITVSGVPKELEYLEYNANGQGQSLTEHAAELFEDALIFGKCHNYVDFPNTEIERVNLVEYSRMGLRPYLARISPINLIGWELSYNNGFENVEHIRILDSDFRVNEDFLEEEREIVRIIRPESIQVYAREYSGVSGMQPRPYGAKLSVVDRAGEGDFELVSETPNELGYVPIQSGYANKRGTFVADPTLEDLAWLNLQHFQSSSDQNNILHITRVPFLLGTGFEEEEVDNITIAANNMVISGNKDASIGYVEHTGTSMQAGRQHGKDLEEQMKQSGAEILFAKSVSRQTATSRKIDQAEALSVAQISLRSIEQMLEQNYKVAADWLDIDNDFEPIVSIGADLNLADDPNPVQGFISLHEALGFDPETALSEAKRRGLIAPHVTIKDIEIMERKQQEPLFDNTPSDSNDEDNNQNEPEQ